MTDYHNKPKPDFTSGLLAGMTSTDEATNRKGDNMKLILSRDDGEVLSIYKIVRFHEDEEFTDLEISIEDLKKYGTKDFESIRRDILLQYK